MVISYDQKYGPIGIVFGLISFFIAIGVVLILGAALGLPAPAIALDMRTVL